LAEIAVLDASAIFTVLGNEPGAEEVERALDDPEIIVLVSSVNLCEVGTKLVRAGRTTAQVSIGLEPFVEYVVDFDLQQARFAAELSRTTRSLGLSLGDRACLALAVSRGGVAWTADRAWMNLDAGVRVRLIRQ